MNLIHILRFSAKLCMYISTSVADVILITSYLLRSTSYGKEETSEVLHLEYIVWCWNLDTTDSRSETPGKF
jgi:low affinity Fe/Cu permease